MTCSWCKRILCVAGVTNEWMEEHFKPIPAIHPDIDRNAITLKVFTNTRIPCLTLLLYARSSAPSTWI